MSTPAQTFDKIKELLESDVAADRSLGMTLFDQVRDENKIADVVFQMGEVYYIVHRHTMRGYNDYNEHYLQFKLNRLIATFDGWFPYFPASEDILIFRENVVDNHIARKDIMFALTPPTSKSL